jgi:beta-lactamase superfamily II metal-dependent hydrolase
LLNASVYHVAPHGSYNGTSDDFTALVPPQVLIISSGDAQREGPGPFHAFQFGHPRQVEVTTI